MILELCLHIILRFRLPLGCALLALLGLTGCSTLGKRLEIRTNPPGATVSTIKGDKLGVTPYVFDGDALSKTSSSGTTSFLLGAPGYVEREILVELHGEDVHEFSLTRIDPTHFTRKVLPESSQQVNEMVRELMRIQAMLFAKKTEEAERSLEGFQKTYPNVAAAYVLLASIESMKGNHDKAKGYLMRAQSIDAQDPVVLRMLGKDVNGKGSP